MRPLRAAVVGCGHVVRLHIRNLRELPDVSVVALCDADAARAAGERCYSRPPPALRPRGTSDAQRLLGPIR